MAGYSDGFLLLYGLCGNVFEKVEEDFSAQNQQVFILKDEQGEIVDDCMVAVLGGRRAFLSRLKVEGARTYFLTPMGAAYWKELLIGSKLTPDPDNVELTKMVFKYSNYKNAAKVYTGLTYEKEFDAKVQEFAELFGLKVIEMKGSPELIERCYEEAKARLLKKLQTQKSSAKFENKV